MDNNNVSDFWKRLEEKQRGRGKKKSLRAICENTGIPYQTVVNQKCDNRFPTVSVIVALAEELDCSIDWLLTGSERQFSEELNNVKEKVRSAVEILQKLN